MLKLIKTNGGNNGAPIKCDICDNTNFRKSGIAWVCCGCGSYKPVDFNKGVDLNQFFDKLNTEVNFRSPNLERVDK